MAVHNHKSYIAHRLSYYLFTVLQFIIDVALFQLCISFTVPAETWRFLTGTMSACFIFGRLYGFRNFSLWDETGAALRVSVLMFLVNVLYLYAVKSAVSFVAVMIGTMAFILLTLTAGRLTATMSTTGAYGSTSQYC